LTLIKQKRHQSKKLRDSARGQECQVRSPVCNGDTSTTVLAHLNGGGMGTKHSDLLAAFACSSCHNLIDGNYQGYSPHFVTQIHCDAIFRTQKIWLDTGLVTMDGQK